VTGGNPEFGSLLAGVRQARGLSLADLAGSTFVSRGWINNVEAGRRWPDRGWAEQVERVLLTDGRLIAEWERGEQARADEASLTNLIKQSERESRLLLAVQPDGVDLDFLNESVADLAVAYLASAPQPMLEEAMALRRELMRRLSLGAMRPSEMADLYVALGRVSGILSYAALDLGHNDAAMLHGSAAWQMADLAGDNELKSWTRGTQSLIARFDKRYQFGQELIADGMKYAGSGTSEVRLICGAAQCAANLGDGRTAFSLIEQASRARERSKTDSIDGLFGFSPAKQAYYSASSLMWLPDRAALGTAIQSATLAIETWETEAPEHRSLDDEALAHVYLATARLKLGEIEGAMDAARPIMKLPEERQISWIRNRIADLGDILEDSHFKNSPLAQNARDELRSYRS